MEVEVPDPSEAEAEEEVESGSIDFTDNGLQIIETSK